MGATTDRNAAAATVLARGCMSGCMRSFQMSLREETEKVATHCLREYRAFQIVQLGASQDALFGTYSQIAAQIRKIRSIQDLMDSRHIA